MNTEQMLMTLYRLFEDCTFHSLFLKELESLLKRELCGKESKFFKILTVQLANIKSFGTRIDTVDGHERIHGADGHYYSIHLQQSQFNVRFIVYIFDDGIPYFLCAFYERAGKGRTDYSRNTKVMKQRFHELIGDDTDE